MLNVRSSSFWTRGLSQEQKGRTALGKEILDLGPFYMNLGFMLSIVCGVEYNYTTWKGSASHSR